MRGPYPMRDRKRGPQESLPTLLIRNAKTFWWMGWLLMGFCITFLPGRTERQSTGRFQGKKWRKHGWTLGATPIYETPWSLVELHTVQINSKILQNWLWVEEKPAVNILARQDGKFLIFKQTKYGLLKDSLAPVGGMIEPNEQPLATAKRELLEELSLVSDKWTPLGTFRTAVNRGGGFSTFYIADDCRPSKTKKASDDLEKQEVLKMSLDEVRKALMAGEFGEVKWTANIALALLHLESQDKPEAAEEASEKQRNLQEVSAKSAEDEAVQVAEVQIGEVPEGGEGESEYEKDANGEIVYEEAEKEEQSSTSATPTKKSKRTRSKALNSKSSKKSS